MRVALLRPPLAPIYMWFLVSTWWDVFFSPFAAYRRIIEAVMIVVVADMLEKKMPVFQKGWRRMGAVLPARSFGHGNP